MYEIGFMLPIIAIIVVVAFWAKEYYEEYYGKDLMK